jgi:hypothetical protein
LIWKVKTEPKCRFFAWLAIQGKAPTTDNLLRQNWPCNQNCALCYCMLETNDHILTEYNFSEAVWDKIGDRYQLRPSLNWLQILSSSSSKKQQMNMQASFSSFGGSFGRNVIK